MKKKKKSSKKSSKKSITKKSTKAASITDLEKVIKKASALSIVAAVEAAKLLLKKQQKISSLKIKIKEAQGIASNADLESESIIIKHIKKSFPDHYILAEESAYESYNGEMEKYKFLKSKEWVWVIDPLDGTNNYLNGLDYYAICISLLHKGVPVIGLVLRPTNQECFFALKGKGATRIKYSSDYKKILITEKLKKFSRPKKALKDSLLVTGFTTEKGPVFDQEFALFKSMIGKSRGIRRMGSAALDLCYVALGHFDLFWERGLASWDVSAAGMICSESGLTVSDYEGRSFHPFQETIVACRPSLHREILSLFSKSL